MNANFRNFAIWVIIALLLVALFNLFQSNSSGTRRASEVPYSELVAAVDSGNVSEVDIRGHKIEFQYRDKPGKFISVNPDDATFVCVCSRASTSLTTFDTNLSSIIAI